MKRKHQGSTFHVLAGWSAEMSAPVLTRRALRTELCINHCLQQPCRARFGGSRWSGDLAPELSLDW